MNIKFKTFKPYWERVARTTSVYHPAAQPLNEWLEENPNVEVISWQTTAVGEDHELYITIQYRVFEEN